MEPNRMLTPHSRKILFLIFCRGLRLSGDASNCLKCHIIDLLCLVGSVYTGSPCLCTFPHDVTIYDCQPVATLLVSLLLPTQASFNDAHTQRLPFTCSKIWVRLRLQHLLKMSIIREYRIPLPITVDEYHIAQLYSVAEASKNETGGGDGVEVVINEPYVNDPDHGGSGQYTYKMMHLQSKVPNWLRKLAPAGSLTLEEEAWNAFPYCKTVYTNKSYMKENFRIEIISWHKEERVSKTDNANKHHTLTESELAKRTVEFIDIVNDPVSSSDYKLEEDPTKFKSEKTGRGPLQGPDWYSNCEPYMCCYKLYKVQFKWRFIQTAVQSLIMKAVRRLLLNFHRQVFCWMDKWHGLTIKDIRDIEEKTKHELDQQRQQGETRGMKEQ